MNARNQTDEPVTNSCCGHGNLVTAANTARHAEQVRDSAADENPVASTSFGVWLAQKLSRVTSSGELIPEIDGLRFVAITAVIMHHLMAVYLITTSRLGPVEGAINWSQLNQQSWLVALTFAGYFGVQLFFVISGFILALPFARNYLAGSAGPCLKSYYLRRLIRIEPPYFFSLIVMFLYHWRTNPGRWLFVPHLFASMIYSHNIVYGDVSWINGVAWSLEVEVQFYVIVPALAYVFAVRNAVLRQSLLTGAILFFSLVSEFFIPSFASKRLFLTLLYHLQYFLAGFLLADVYLARQKQPFKRLLRWDAVTAVSGVAILLIVSWPGGAYHFPLPFLTAAFCWSVFRGRLANAFLTLRWITIFGGMCYTLYLYHGFIIHGLLASTMRLASPARPLKYDFMFQCLLLCPSILIICSGLFVFTEKPFMKLSRLVRYGIPLISPRAQIWARASN